MTDDATNLEIRRFLKQFGVAAQRAIEDAARAGRAGTSLRLTATLAIDNQPQSHVERGEIRIG